MTGQFALQDGDQPDEPRLLRHEVLERWKYLAKVNVWPQLRLSDPDRWLRDESLEDSANLPDPHILAAEIADDLRASLEQIEDVLADLQARATARS